MKKVFMSLVAVALFSASTFAGTNEKTTEVVTGEKENKTANITIRSIEETEEVREAGKLLTTCKHTLVFVNQSGEVLYQSTSYDTAGPNEVFKTCGEFFAHRRGYFQGLGYEFKR